MLHMNVTKSFMP